MDCPVHPELGLTCQSVSPGHTLCTHDTRHEVGPLSSYSASWVRVWWRDGRPLRSSDGRLTGR